jgi:hypothetical protein
MYTTTDERGILNNYATEPKMYYAEYPTVDRQRQYAFQAAIATLLIVGTVLTAFGVS